MCGRMKPWAVRRGPGKSGHGRRTSKRRPAMSGHEWRRHGWKRPASLIDGTYGGATERRYAVPSERFYESAIGWRKLPSRRRPGFEVADPAR